MFVQLRFLEAKCSRRVIAIFIAFAIFLTSIQTVSAQLTAEALLSPIVEKYGPQYADVEAAIESLRSNNAAEAKRQLQTAYEKNRDIPPPDTILAQILFRLRQVEAGRQSLQNAISNHPDDPAAYVYLGELALQQGRMPESAAMYKQGLEKCVKYNLNSKRKKRLLANAYSGLALLEEQKKNWSQAKGLLDKLLQNDPDNSLAMTRLGRVLFKMAKNRDDEKKAYQVFINLHKKDEKTARPEVNMGLLYEQDGRRGDAERLMTLAVEKDGKNIRTRLAVAKWALDAGNMSMAKQNAEAAGQIDPNALEVKLFRGLIHRFNENFKPASDLFKEAHFQSPTHLGAMTQLALTLIEQDDEQTKRQALGFAEICIRMYPDLNRNPGREAAVVYAWCLHKLGRPKDAAKAIAQAVTKGSISADSAYFAARILYDNGQSQAAKKILDPILASGKAFPNAKSAKALVAKIQ